MNSPQVVNSYLAQLESALRGVEPGVREEIVAGIREELDGLGTADAATRIEALGDPEFIAAEARAASLAPMSMAPPAKPSTAFPIVAAFIVMSGGLIFPLIGGIVGLVLVCGSKAWTSAEKLIAVVVPGSAVLYAIILELSVRTGHTLILVILGLFIIDGIWLLWRVLRRR